LVNALPARRGGRDWFKVIPQEMYALPTPGFGVARFHFELFTTVADGCDSFPHMYIKRACYLEEEPILPWNNAFKLCSWLCGNVDDCEDLGEHSCDPCPFVSHQFLTWDLVDTIGGRGVLIIEFAGQERYSQTFDFTAGTNERGVPTNIGVAFLNKDSGPMSPADVHDPQEAFGIIISVDWWGTPFETYSASIKSRNLNDSIIVSCRMIGRIGMRAYYIKMLPAGSLSSIYGDFSGVPPCYNPDILTAKAVGYECDEEIPHQDDEARFGNIPLYVTSLSFLNDFSLYEDSILGTTDPPPYKEILIEDPVWVLNPPRNKSAFYQRNSRPSITLEIRAQCNIAHSLDYQTIGIPSTPYPINKYCTTIDSGRIFGYVDTISGITLQYANFPDSVGIIDSLKYHWMYRKSLIGGAQGFRPMSTTGPHKIYLSYDVPRLDTVNELGLKYICNWARDLDDSLMIFKTGIEKIYKQHWKYDPKDTIIFHVPLDFIRTSEPYGMCTEYANFATYCLNILGLSANTTLIFNGRDNPPYIDYYSFIYSKDLPLRHFYNLWSIELKPTSGATGNRLFIYHAVTRLGQVLGDPVFNIIGGELDYTKWWKYYLHPYPEQQPFSHDEPPPFPPYFFNCDIFAIPRENGNVGPINLRTLGYDFAHP
jgi:hypothetical protein